METKTVTPMLFPYDPAEYWEQMRKIIREEIKDMEASKANEVTFETPGMTYKPLYKIKEVCALLGVTRPTIYDWVKHGKLKPYKIRSRVYFLWDDIQNLLHPE
jgi:excisionase family DNA binding protein